MIGATEGSREKCRGSEQPVKIPELMKGQKKRLDELKVLEMGLEKLNCLGGKTGGNETPWKRLEKLNGPRNEWRN